MMRIKPVMHVDDQGRLINVAKARGRKASLDALVDHMEQTAFTPENQTIYISHGDCIEDAEYVADQCRKRLHVKDVLIHYVDPVIGAHSGPAPWRCSSSAPRDKSIKERRSASEKRSGAPFGIFLA